MRQADNDEIGYERPLPETLPTPPVVSNSMISNKAILHFPVEFDSLYTDKGYWPYAIVELPNGEHFFVYFAQICSFDLPTMHDPCFAPPGLIVVPEVTIPNMEKAVQELYESGRFFPFFKPIANAFLKSIELKNWPPLPPPSPSSPQPPSQNRPRSPRN